MARMTKDYIEGLEAKVKLYREPVDGVRGLYLQVSRTKSGVVSKTWVFRYRLYFQGTIYGPGNRPSKEGSYTIGEWPRWTVKRATDRADELRDKVKRGEDPEELPKPKKVKAELAPAPPPVDLIPTIRTVAEDFFREHVRAKNAASTQRFQRWALNSRVLPALGDLKIDEVTPHVVTRFLDGLSATPVAANRIRALLSKMFNWAVRRVDVLAGKANPVTGHERHEETAREVRMTEDQIRTLGVNYQRVMTATSFYSQEDKKLTHAVIFLLLTGARCGVVLCQQKRNQFPDEQVLRFDAKAPGLKGCRSVYLPTAALKLLPEIPFNIDRLKLWSAWLGIRPEGCECTLHDLRRTFLSVAADMGFDEAVVDALVHKSRGKIRDTYFRRADPTLQAVAENIGHHIAELLGLAKPVKAKATKAMATAR